MIDRDRKWTLRRWWNCKNQITRDNCFSLTNNWSIFIRCHYQQLSVGFILLEIIKRSYPCGSVWVYYQLINGLCNRKSAKTGVNSNLSKDFRLHFTGSPIFQIITEKGKVYKLVHPKISCCIPPIPNLEYYFFLENLLFKETQKFLTIV